MLKNKNNKNNKEMKMIKNNKDRKSKNKIYNNRLPIFLFFKQLENV